MDKAQSEHLARVRHLRESFVEANERLVARRRRVSDEAAEREADGAWSAAQIGWHVAAVTTRFAAMIAGDLVGSRSGACHGLPGCDAATWRAADGYDRCARGVGDENGAGV